MVHEAKVLTTAVSSMALLPALAVAVPLAGALLVALLRRAPSLRNAMVIMTSAVTLVLVASMYRPALWGAQIGGVLYKGLALDLPAVAGVGLHFRVDAVALVIALVTALIYLLSNIFALSYMDHEHAQTRYYVFLLLTLAANLGVFVSADFFTLFVFFEMMAITSFVLVIHGENFSSMTAGRIYLFMSVVGGLVLLGGVALLSGYAGRLEIAPLAESVREQIPPGILVGAATMMIVGFGTKAGLFFLHVWLPEAHPVAPSPASALLSGLMVKVGIYGILRTALTLLAPVGKAEGWTVQTSIGYGLIIIATITMFGGMVNALLCKNAKELLAYSTISQIGYITLGLGVAAYMGAEGAMGLGGSLYHVLNHAVFKAALFLCIGVVVYRVAELDITQLGGLWRKLPVTAAVAGLAALSIVGIPGTAGFASKTLLHDSVKEAIEYSTRFSAVHSRDPVLVVVEILFLLTAAGTFCYVTKLFMNVFLGKLPRQLEQVEEEPWLMRVALAPLGLLILIFGVLPNLPLEKLVGPALSGFGLDPASFAYEELFNVHTLRSALPLLYDPLHGGILNEHVVTNLLGISLPVLVGGAYFVIGYRFRVFDVRTPELFSVKVWYEKCAHGFVGALAMAGSAFDSLWDRLVVLLAVRIWIPKKTYRGTKPPLFLPWITGRLYALCTIAAKVNSGLDHVVSRVLVDTWLSEPEHVATEHKGLGGMAYWISDANSMLDKAVTAVMVDAWVAESRTGAVTMPRLTLSPHAEHGPRRMTPFGERYRWVGTAEELYDRLVSTVMIEAWMPEQVGETQDYEPVPDGNGDVLGEPEPPQEPPGEEPAEEPSAEEPEVEERRGERQESPLAESWRLLSEWTKGSGERAWQIILFVFGTVVLIVALLIGMGYLRV